MRASIGWDDAVRIPRDVFVQKDRFLRQLYDLSGRSDSGNAGLAAIEHGIGAALVIRQVLDLRKMLGFEGRPRCGRLHAVRRAGVTVSCALINLLNGDLAVDFFFQRCGCAIDCVAPDAAQVRMPCLLCRDDALDENRACDESEDSVRHHLASEPLTSSYDVPSGSLTLSM